VLCRRVVAGWRRLGSLYEEIARGLAEGGDGIAELAVRASAVEHELAPLLARVAELRGGPAAADDDLRRAIAEVDEGAIALLERNRELVAIGERARDDCAARLAHLQQARATRAEYARIGGRAPQRFASAVA